MSNETVFYVFGGALVAAAVIVAALGLRLPSFPGSRAMLTLTIAVFAVLVGGTTTFAVLNAEDEQEAREAEEAEGTTGEKPAEEPSGQEQPSGETGTTGPASQLKVAADPTGQLAYVQKSLSTKAGAVEITLTNDSPVGHDVCIEDSTGGELGCSDVVTGGTAAVSATVEAGQYTYYCSVDGHQAAGMEGTLSVK
jgi:plastocyanin